MCSLSIEKIIAADGFQQNDWNLYPVDEEKNN